MFASINLRPTLPQAALRNILPLIAILVLSGCASAPGRTTNDDPLQGFNRGVYKFNTVVDKATLKPVAKGYQKITPQWMRTGVSNFFSNLGEPWTVLNELFQGKPKAMGQQTGRFLINTVLGVGGFIDVASKMNLPAQNEDFGQTLAVWGVPSGPYVVLPILGPSTIRDGLGRVPDYFGHPLTYADVNWKVRTGLAVTSAVSAREKLLSIEGTLDKAYDKYGVLRDVWVQQREYQIYDGNPPQSEEDEGNFDDSESAEPKASKPDASSR
jgi:phospholipid-binding lipoprotein MlaA